MKSITKLRKQNIYKTNKKYTRKHKYRKQKGGWTITLMESIKNTTDQNDLACLLRVNPSLQNICIFLFWDILVKLKLLPDYEKLLIREITIQKNKEDVIERIGFEIDEVKEIITYLNTNNKDEFIKLEFLRKKIHTISTSINYIGGPDTFPTFIMNDEELFDEFITKLRKIFYLPDSFTKVEFTKLYEEAKEKSILLKSFNMLISKLLLNDDNIVSVFTKNYSREIFSRNNATSPKVSKNIMEHYKCFDDVNGEDIYDITSTINIHDTFLESLFKLYNRQIIGGVSGSSHYLYFMVFRVLKWPTTIMNLLKVLSIAVMDYVPIWHSLEEILLTYSGLFSMYGHKINIYTLDQDPLEYYKNLFTELELEPEQGSELELNS